MQGVYPLYLIFVCPRCGSLRYAREAQKSAVCFKCRYRIALDPVKIRILLKTTTREEAKVALEHFKMKT